MTETPSRVTSTVPGPVWSDRTILRHWGDDVGAGHVNDHVYVSSERLYQIVLTMPAGASFRHSERNRTIFGADELYLVLRGAFVLANPETGEVLRLGEGDLAVFGPDTWHHGFVVGSEDAAVLEYFAPPPAAGMSQAYARTKPYLGEWRYGIDEPLGDRNLARAVGRTMRRLDTSEFLWRLEGSNADTLVGTMLSTPRLRVETLELGSGRNTGPRRHRGDLGIFVREGTPTVSLPGDGGNGTWRLTPGDGFFVPAGTTYHVGNDGTRPARWVAGVAPADA